MYLPPSAELFRNWRGNYKHSPSSNLRSSHVELSNHISAFELNLEYKESLHNIWSTSFIKTSRIVPKYPGKLRSVLSKISSAERWLISSRTTFAIKDLPYATYPLYILYIVINNHLARYHYPNLTRIDFPSLSASLPLSSPLYRRPIRKHPKWKGHAIAAPLKSASTIRTFSVRKEEGTSAIARTARKQLVQVSRS